MIIRTGALYQAFKYSIYALLAVNTGHYFLENLTGAAYTYQGGMALGDIIVAYTDAIDTAAWLVLLLLLELETFVIPDEKFKGWVDWSISSLSLLCYGVILYSFYGYAATLGIPFGFEPYAGPDACGLLSDGASFAKTLDEYEPLNAENCLALASGAYYNESLNMFAAAEGYSLLSRLVWLDVLNAGIWVIIVGILELELFLHASKWFGTRFFIAYKSFKLLLYGVLALDVIYWLYLGKPWDAWDAFLWLVAFFFIEMNVLTWQEEIAHKKAAAEPA